MKRSSMGWVAFALMAGLFVGTRINADIDAPPDGMIAPPGTYIEVPSVGPNGPPAPMSDMRVQWEYTVVRWDKIAHPPMLNHFGNDGWEMCGIRQRGEGSAYYFFKREKLAPNPDGSAWPEQAKSGEVAAESKSLTLPPTTTLVPQPPTMPLPTPPAGSSTDSKVKPIGSAGVLQPVNPFAPRSEEMKSKGEKQFPPAGRAY